MWLWMKPVWKPRLKNEKWNWKEARRGCRLCRVFGKDHKLIIIAGRTVNIKDGTGAESPSVPRGFWYSPPIKKNSFCSPC